MNTGNVLNVLIVDDSALMRKLIAKCLKTIDGITLAITEAGSGLEALAAIENSNQIPDLILCDLNMPKLNGLSLLRNVRATPALDEVPFIVITANHADEMARQAMREGAAGIIGKPFSSEALIAMIKKSSKTKSLTLS